MIFFLKLAILTFFKSMKLSNSLFKFNYKVAKYIQI